VSAPFGDEAGDTRHHLSSMTKLYRRKRIQGGGLRLDMSAKRATDHPAGWTGGRMREDPSARVLSR
jgi:hypothetical protein